MGRGIIKGFSGVFFNRPNLMAVVCILSFAAGAAYTNAGRPATLFNTTKIDSVADTQPSLNDSEVKASIPDSEVSIFDENKADNNSEPKSESSEKWRIVRMRVTGYCPCSKCCGKYADGITACGYKIRPGDTFVAADKRYSFGTEVIIEGYNDGEPIKVLDRGGAIRGNKLDAFFHTHEEALEWGVKYIDVKVLDK